MNKYRNYYWGILSVKQHDDGLQLHIGTEVFDLVYLSSHVFKFTTIGEDRDGDTQVIFAVGLDDVVESMQINYFVEQGAMGVFFPV